MNTAEMLKPEPELRSVQSERLQALREEAAAVREQLAAREITPDEATKRLNDLRSRHVSFLNRVFSF